MKINIEQVLKNQNKTMYWLSKETGIAYPTIHNIVKGKTEKIEFGTMEKIAKALDASLDEIFKVE
jgi:DNA-binding Xre family transcriptional regulator